MASLPLRDVVVNKARPRCPKCGTAMEPLYMRRRRGKGMVRFAAVFACREHGILASGRKRTRFLA
jgi:hypothetical protein